MLGVEPVLRAERLRRPQARDRAIPGIEIESAGPVQDHVLATSWRKETGCSLLLKTQLRSIRFRFTE